MLQINQETQVRKTPFWTSQQHLLDISIQQNEIQQMLQLLDSKSTPVTLMQICKTNSIKPW